VTGWMEQRAADSSDYAGVTSRHADYTTTPTSGIEPTRQSCALARDSEPTACFYRRGRGRVIYCFLCDARVLITFGAEHSRSSYFLHNGTFVFFCSEILNRQKIGNGRKLVSLFLPTYLVCGVTQYTTYGAA
jgi:hypothetical protein